VAQQGQRTRHEQWATETIQEAQQEALHLPEMVQPSPSLPYLTSSTEATFIAGNLFIGNLSFQVAVSSLSFPQPTVDH
jgi:hypothetical protein